MMKFTSGLLLALLLSGGVSADKYASLVNQKATEVAYTSQQEWLSVRVPSGDPATKVRTVKNSFIPAILYWGWNGTLDCDVSPDYSGKVLRNAMQRAADSLNLQQRIGDNRKLEITIDAHPSGFQYTNRGSTVILLVAYSTSSLEAIIPAGGDLHVSYRLVDGDESVATGSALALNADVPVRNVWKSTKKFTWFYLSQYESELARMATSVMEEIAGEL
ncbi:hypothetical protein GGR28_001135 [Lewinella aquimaris]|uniref:DUF3313 domain-containing protein n=1 Tax=Neolewinella aquimaris TaxID=1835722 RepID=A0A840E455_9BACT|nr:hypothetical protein [Neolewinella aquimaris]MBB4078522.1 hypothetical protein [Neolewinella aquimaris]